MRVLAALVLCAGTATAAPHAIEFRTAADGSLRARQPVAPNSAATHAHSRTLYLNRDGGVLSPGPNNSQSNTSSLIQQASTIAGWEVSDVKWAETLACVRAMWAPFDVDITDSDPGTTAHVEVHIGGSPTSIGFPVKIGGVAPMAIDCSVVEHSIVFVFPENLHHDVQSVCEVVAQEVGHSLGLDHELEPSDPMTYLSYAGERTFQDRTAACGETTARPCGINGSHCRANQNSYQILLDRLGAPGSDHDPPMLDVVAPRDGSVVAPGSSVIAHASDDVEVTQITLYVDGQSVATESSSLEYALDLGLAAGPHELVIEVADAAGNTTTRQLAVRIDAGEADEADEADVPVPMMGCSTGGDPSLALGVFLLLLYCHRRCDIRRRASSDQACRFRST